MKKILLLALSIYGANAFASEKSSISKTDENLMKEIVQLIHKGEINAQEGGQRLRDEIPGFKALDPIALGLMVQQCLENIKATDTASTQRHVKIYFNDELCAQMLFY